MMANSQPATTEIAAENERLQFALGAAGIGTWDLDPINRIIRWKEHCRNLYGFSKDAVVPYDQVLRHVHPDDGPRVTEAVQRALNPRSGGQYDIRYRTVHADDGQLRWLHCKGRAYADPTGQTVYRFSGIAQDITQDVLTRQAQQHEAARRADAERALAQSQSELIHVFEQAPVAIAILRGPDYVFEMANPKACELMGRTADQLMGKPLLEAVRELSGQTFKELLDNVRQTGTPFVGTEVPAVLHRRGHTETGYFNLAYKLLQEPQRSADPDTTRIMVIGTDVTESVLTRRKVEESEVRFRSLIEEAPVATCLFVGPAMTIEVANETMLGYWGKGRTVIGQPLEEALPELTGQPFPAILKEAFTTGIAYKAKAARVELEVDGVLSSYYFDFTYKPLRNTAGAVYAIMNMAVDVTEEAKASKKLQASEQYFRQLTDTVPAILWITESDGSCSYLNRQWYDYTGQTEAEAEGFGWLNATHPEDKDEAAKLFIAATENQTTFNALYRLRQKDGRYRWAIDKASPRFNANGEYEGMIGTVVDVHDQKLAEEEKQKLASIVEASHEFIGLAGADTSVQYANPAALTMLGWDTYEGKTILDCIYPEDRPLAEKLLAQLLEKGHFSHEIRLLNKPTGDPFWLQWNAVTINDATSGAIMSLGTISPNITERKKAEKPWPKVKPNSAR